MSLDLSAGKSICSSGDARYVDELERTLYGAVLAGVSLQGDTYFYENPLEARTESCPLVLARFPCCPPMFLKIAGALPGYIYAQDASGIYVNLFVGSRAEVRFLTAKWYCGRRRVIRGKVR